MINGSLSNTSNASVNKPKPPSFTQHIDLCCIRIRVREHALHFVTAIVTSAALAQQLPATPSHTGACTCCDDVAYLLSHRCALGLLLQSSRLILNFVAFATAHCGVI